MLELYFSNQFKKDYKTIKKRKLPIEKLEKVLTILQSEKELPSIYGDHALTGQWQGFESVIFSQIGY